MSGIINGFQAIISGIGSFWSIIINLFKAIGQAFTYILNMGNVVSILIGQMPTWLAGFMYASLVISILYIIIGRVGGHN